MTKMMSEMTMMNSLDYSEWTVQACLFDRKFDIVSLTQGDRMTKMKSDEQL